jgi:aminopeptidase N
MPLRVLAIAAVVGCAGGGVRPAGAPSLRRDDAEARAQIIHSVDYDLELDLSGAGDRYRGRVLIQFTVAVPGRDLRVDFAGGEVTRAALDGRPFAARYDGRAITIPGAMLRAGIRRLEISFDQAYSRDSRGLARFVDPVDGNVYLYTDLEPYAANRAFPCFDQPDLKATYTLQVTVPRRWQVITSIRETGVVERAGAAVWKFPRSARYSTYVFPLHAGAYAVWEDRSFRIPLRLFARRSLAGHVPAEAWLATTRYGLDFFESYFGYPYPYGKYDQVIVPELGNEAMENVAAVTFHERLVGRGASSGAQLRARADSILHEMAHMWFGNLVTMRWWGDLWLNEAFATYMASVALAAHRGFEATWQAWFAAKVWAYQADELVTTHPIVSPAHDTDEALASFDDITYYKAAAIVAQIAFVIGEDAFRRGLAIYFARHAGRNATYHDFIAAMAEAAPHDWADWRRSWLETAGLNALSARYDCAGDKLSRLQIVQTTVSGPPLMRRHVANVALLAGAELAVADVVRVDVAGPSTDVAAAVGRPCPRAVYLNHGDHGYFRSTLDDRSAAALARSIGTVGDPLLRQQLWYALWDRVRDGELDLLRFADLLVSAGLARERDELTLQQLIRNARDVLRYGRRSAAIAEAALPALADRLDREVWRRLQEAGAGTGEQLLWADALPTLLTSPWGRGKLQRLLDGGEPLTGLALDQDRRWDLVNALARIDDPTARRYIEREALRDPSSLGAERRIAATAAVRGDWDAKMRWVDDLERARPAHSLSQLRAAITQLFPDGQADLRERFGERFFRELVQVSRDREPAVAALFAELAPSECDPRSAGRLARFLAAHPTLPPVVVTKLKIAAQEGERCRRIVGLAERGGSAR